MAIDFFWRVWRVGKVGCDDSSDEVGKTIAEFIDHYHTERNHQGLQNRLIHPEADIGSSAGEIACRERLGGMLKHYHRQAA